MRHLFESDVATRRQGLECRRDVLRENRAPLERELDRLNAKYPVALTPDESLMLEAVLVRVHAIDDEIDEIGLHLDKLDDLDYETWLDEARGEWYEENRPE